MTKSDTNVTYVRNLFAEVMSSEDTRKLSMKVKNFINVTFVIKVFQDQTS